MPRVLRIALLLPLLLTARILLGKDAPSPPPGLVAHWKFDGDAEDSSASPHPGHVVGRAQFLDSVIGGGGKLLALNGVDAYVQVDNAGSVIPAPESEATVSLWCFPLDSKAAGLLSLGDSAGPGWSLRLLQDGSLVFAFRGADGKPTAQCKSAAGSVRSGQWHCVVVTMQHGDVRVFVNSVECGVGKAPTLALPATAALTIGRSSEANSFFSGLIDDARVYSRALSTEEVAATTEAGLFAATPRPGNKLPFDGRFTLADEDVVVFTGGENAREAQRTGYLESMLAVAAGDKRVIIRSMAWEGDTAFEQPRVFNFPDWRTQLDRVGATVLFADFGQMESLRGPDGLGPFIAAYEKLLDTFSARTQRIVLLSPAPLETVTSPTGQVADRNARVKLYVDAIRELAARRHFLFVDRFTPLLPATAKAARTLTRDGVHLTPFGQWRVARETMRQLGMDCDEAVNTGDADIPFVRPATEKLRAVVRDKDLLWLEYWRPANWAFLSGDRTDQPSSRDHRDPRIRWFPSELQEFPAMIQKQETQIMQLAKAAASH